MENILIGMRHWEIQKFMDIFKSNKISGQTMLRIILEYINMNKCYLKITSNLLDFSWVFLKNLLVEFSFWVHLATPEHCNLNLKPNLILFHIQINYLI